MGRSSSRWATILPRLAANRHALSGVIIILVCQAISKDHVIKRSYNFVGKSQQYTNWGYQNILEHILVWGHWKILSSKNQIRKIVIIHKKIELYQVFMYNFVCQTVLIFSIYILFAKIIETFWSRGVTNIWVVAYLGPNVFKKFDRKNLNYIKFLCAKLF